MTCEKVNGIETGNGGAAMHVTNGSSSKVINFSSLL